MQVGVFYKKDSRNVLRKIVLSSLLFAVISGYGFAQDAISLYIENDSRRMKPNHATDRHYTHGTKIVYLTQPNWQWLETFSQGLLDKDQPVETAVGFFLGQNIYTPDHADDPMKRSEDDRVFAGWLYGGIFAQRATHDYLDHFELNLGVIGPSSRGEQFQRYTHKLIHSNEPIGWEEQLSDEFAIDLTIIRKQRLQDGWFKPTESTDFITEYGFTVGSVHRHLQADITFRYGFNLENTFGPGRMALPSGISTLRKDKSSQSGYLFARATGKVVEHDRFLTGLDHKPLVGEIQVGLVCQYKKLELEYSQTFFTQEYEEQTSRDCFGAVTLSWKF